jgi:hypothetical protein
MHEWRQYVGPGRLAFSIHGVSKCIGPSWKKAAEAVVPLVDGETGTSWRARAEEDKPDDEMYGISVTGKC